MGSAANASDAAQLAGRPKASRPVVVPVIPLPLVQKQQQQRQQREQKQQKLKEEEEKKREQERLEKEQKEREEAQWKTDEERRQTEETERQSKVQQEQHMPSLSGGAPSTDTTPANPASSPPSSTTPQTTVGTVTSASSPAPKSMQSAAPINASAGSSTAAPATVASSKPETKESKKFTKPASQVVSSRPKNDASFAPSSTAPPNTNSNGHGMTDFVFPQQRNGSGGRHRGNFASRQAFNGPHQPHQAHQPHHPSFHQAHSSNNASFGAYHDSNSTSPVANGRAPFPPPPGLMPVPPPFVPYGAPTMGGSDWPGPPLLPLGDVNGGGFTPTAAGFNPSTPGSFQSSRSPDNVADGPFNAPQVGGPFPVPVQNGTIPMRNEPIPAVLSPPFFVPHGFPGGGPPPPVEGPMRGGMPTHGIDAGLIHHFQQQIQHNFETPQTADCHLFVHLPSQPRHAAPAANTSGKHGEQQETPIIFVGHRAVLSQSYTIGELLRSDVVSAHPGPLNHPIFTAPVKIDDPFVTTAAVMQALRSLYGFPVEDVSVDQSRGAARAEVQVVDQGLANLTAGFLFMLHPVELAGAEQAARAIGWSTVEKVLAYCLNGASFPNVADRGRDAYGMPHTQAQFRYGRGAGLAIRLLLRKACEFLVEYFPAYFSFDAAQAVSVQDSFATLRRFPAKASRASSSSEENEAANGAANGPNGHVRPTQSRGSVSLPASRTIPAHDKRDSRTSNIVFGDFGAKADGTHTTAEALMDSVPLMSRMLVELPFSCLKYVLEHPELSLSTNRESVARDVVVEREKRRKQALDDLRAGHFPLSASERDVVLGRVLPSAPPVHRDYPVDCWDVLGWREYVTERGDLVRAWGQPDAGMQ